MSGDVKNDEIIADVMLEICDEDVGAMRVVCMIVEKIGVKSADILVKLRKYGVTGSKIWVGYKDFCGCDVDAFIDCIETGWLFDRCLDK